ncbi:cell wall-binding repeat-containing protein [Bacillus sp. JJ1533]|uniref:cell wall-binding repeat-containing protein n=1 Tax=Bacillus sp. JJ1533 TaxID=3122959 RepID=UPI002FFE4AE8
MEKRSGLIVCILVGILLVLGVPSLTSAAEINVERISGNNRYETAVKVSKEGWSTADTVVLATGTNFPDALTGTPLAYALNAPILLTKKDEIPGATKSEITRLGASKVLILGGTATISTTVETELVNLGLKVERISGETRYDTSVKIAERLGSTADTAIVAFGGNFPDSLSIAAYAAKNKLPIFLVTNSSIPKEVKQALEKYERTIVVGGTSVISDKVYEQLNKPTRISGEDRYTTSARVVKQLSPSNLTPVYLATGKDFADALTGSLLAAKKDSAILLVRPDEVPAPVNSVLNQITVTDVAIIGGAAAVSEKVVQHFTYDLTSDLIKTAKSLMGTPYLWAGTTPNGFDCSGYLNYVFAKHGIQLPRTVASIWNAGTSVSSPQVGDIVFFEKTYDKEGPTHAGIYLGNNEFIHAGSSTGVTIANLNISYWKDRYLGSKSYY